MRRLANLKYAGGLALISGEDRRVTRKVQKLASAKGLNLLGALLNPASKIMLRDLLTRTLKKRLRRVGTPTEYGPSEIELAIATDQLVLHYQPQVNLASGAVVGVESMVRWQHPRDGLVSADRFVPLAEHHGLIDLLTHSVLKMALRQIRQWREEAGLAIDVSFNVSMDNLSGLEFPDLVIRQLEKNRLPPSCLVLEVSERGLMQSQSTTTDILSRLELRRLRLSIDNFGTGDSSMTQLRDMPFRELKIDRSLVSRAACDPALQGIIEASLSTARQLGLRTVAEGAENIRDWKYVHSAGFDAAQGHFIGRPMRAERLPAWLDEWRGRFDALVAQRHPGCSPRFESWPQPLLRREFTGPYA